MSCLLLMANLIHSVTPSLYDCFQNVEITCWNDNASAIGWIKGVDKVWGAWEQNRVTKIRNIVPADQWKHVPGSLNPADIGTRNITAKDVSGDSIWFNGPNFLYQPPSEWPVTNVGDMYVLPEEKVEHLSTINVVIAKEVEFPVNINKFSSLYRLHRVVALVLRFKHNLLARVRNSDHKTGDITLTEYEDAEKCVIKYEQLIL